MSAILNFLFPGEPRDSRSSWLLLAARVVFGLLLMSHGIAKLQNFEALSATFPDPLGVGSRVSLVLAVFGEVCLRGRVCGRVTLPAGAHPDGLYDVCGFLCGTRRRFLCRT